MDDGLRAQSTGVILGKANAQYSDARLRSAVEAAGRAGRAGGLLDGPRFHPFPARMPFGIAGHLIQRLTHRDSVVLDPMVGSGTTVIAAQTLCRRALGFDRDPLAVLVARCSTHYLDSVELESLRIRVKERAETAIRRGAVSIHVASRSFDR